MGSSFCAVCTVHDKELISSSSFLRNPHFSMVRRFQDSIEVSLDFPGIICFQRFIVSRINSNWFSRRRCCSWLRWLQSSLMSRTTSFNSRLASLRLLFFSWLNESKFNILYVLLGHDLLWESFTWNWTWAVHFVPFAASRFKELLSSSSFSYLIFNI